MSLLATVATLLGGDDVRLVVEVRDGLSLTLKDIAATVAYDGRGQGASWMAELNVGPGASLVWAAEPFIVSDGAEAMRILRATLADGAGLRLDETVVLGRHGERGGRVHSHTLVQTAEAPLLVEDVVYQGAGEDQRFIRGGARSISTRLAFGTQTLVPAPDELVMELACGGQLARTMHTRDVRGRSRPSLTVDGIRQADPRGSEMPVGEQVHTDAAPAYAEGAVG